MEDLAAEIIQGGPPPSRLGSGWGGHRWAFVLGGLVLLAIAVVGIAALVTRGAPAPPGAIGPTSQPAPALGIFPAEGTLLVPRAQGVGNGLAGAFRPGPTIRIYFTCLGAGTAFVEVGGYGGFGGMPCTGDVAGSIKQYSGAGPSEVTVKAGPTIRWAVQVDRVTGQ